MKRSKILVIMSLAVVLSILAIAIPVAPIMAATGTLSVTPSSGPPGTTVTVSGGNFTSTSSYTVYFDLYNASTGATTSTGVVGGAVDSSGSFVNYYTIPSQPSGSYNFTATTTLGDTSNNAQFQVTPSISVSTSIGRVGDPVNVGGRGFRANVTLRIYFDSNVVAMPVTDNNGVFSTTFKVPEVPQGKHTMYASDQQYSTPNLDFTVTPTLTVSPTTTSVGSTITASGTGFTASSTISFSLDGVGTNTVATANNLGSFSDAQITIPVIAAGSHTLKATDNSGNSDTVAITTSQSLTINPDTGPSGTSITITGGGFSANKNITVTYNGASITTTPSTVTSNATGNFTATIAAPEGPAKTYSVSVSDGTVTSSANFTISATAKVEETTGAVGSSVPVSGSGFNAGAAITIQYDGVGIGSAKTNANGSFSGNFTVPPGLAGEHKITITDGVNTVNTNFTTSAAAQISGPDGSGNKTGGYVGSEVTVKGNAFVPKATLTVTYDSVPVTTTTVGTDGSFTASFKAPVSKGGDHTVVVSDGTNKVSFVYVMDSTPPPAPTLVSPTKGTNAPALTNFQWSSVTDPNGVTYTLEVASDAGFNSIVVQQSGLTTTSYQLTAQEQLSPTGNSKPYYWRVKAIDGASNASPWSTTLTFTVGFIFPTWLMYFLIGVGAVIIFAIGFFVGRRTNRYGY